MTSCCVKQQLYFSAAAPGLGDLASVVFSPLDGKEELRALDKSS